MTLKSRSKSGLFLMELLLNLLLFCLLCGCGLMFFIKSYNLSKRATTLHQAVSITSSVAGIYESGDGTFTSLCQIYTGADLEGKCLCIYLDEHFLPCTKEQTAYYVIVQQLDPFIRTIQIDFHNSSDEILYTLNTRHYTATTLGTAKEVAQ